VICVQAVSITGHYTNPRSIGNLEPRRAGPRHAKTSDRRGAADKSRTARLFRPAGGALSGLHRATNLGTCRPNRRAAGRHIALPKNS